MCKTFPIESDFFVVPLQPPRFSKRAVTSGAADRARAEEQVTFYREGCNDRNGGLWLVAKTTPPSATLDRVLFDSSGTSASRTGETCSEVSQT